MIPHLHLLGATPGLLDAPVGGATSTQASGARAEDRAPTPLLPPGKPYALLCLLALEPHGVTREELIRYLWPDAPLERARASVRQALHVVRKALGGAPTPASILERDGRLTLAPGTVETDLAALEARLAAGDLEGAHAMWRGGPFAHFSLADAPAFNDWADRIRSRWERRLGDALAARAEAERQAGRNADALPWLGRVLDVRPFDERAHALRVELLLELGMLDEAEAALDRARSVVDEPTPGVLDEIEGRLRAARRTLAASAPEGASAPYPTLAFVGRTREMAELRALWRSALSGRPRSVAVLGPAGIGKTRLVEEWARHTVGPDAVVVRAKALDTERVLPLGLAAELAKTLASKPGAAGMANASLAVLRHLVPTLGNGSAPAPSGSLTEVAVAEALLDLTEAVASEAPVVLWLDDFQWADPPSRAVVLRLARSLRAAQVLTVVTCRSGDADLSAVRTLRAEAAAGRFATLELAPLTPGEVFEALSLSLDVRPPEEAERAAARLASASQGNPLFLAELLLRLQADGRITAEEGRWVLHAVALASGDLPLPASVREILEARLGGLPQELHPILGALAHAAGPMGAEELARQVGAPLPAVRGALQALAAQGIVEGPSEASADGAPGGILFAHDSLRAIARDLFPAPRRPSPLRRVPPWALAGGAVAALAAVAFWLAIPWLSRPEAAPLYPGVIYAAQDGLVERFRLPTRRGDSWDTLPSIAIPDHMYAVRLAPRRDGGVDVYGEIYSDRSVPAAARLGADGVAERLLEHDGDVNLRDISPDGRYALLTVADESGGTYRQNLVRYELATGDTLVLLRPQEHAGGKWFPDGGAISAFERGAADTLTLLRPNGTVLYRRPVPWGAPEDSSDPCGPRGRRSVALRWVEGVMELVTWDWASDVVETVWRADIPVLHQFSCSPHGGAAVGVVRLRGASRILVIDLATGDTLLGPALGQVGRVQWGVEAPLPVPSRVETAGPAMVLGWGESLPVSVTVTLADGTTRTDYPVEWRSLDPTVASVRDGVLYANGVGTAAVVASVQGWIADTLRVRVTGASLAGEALLADPFQSFDTARWEVYGAQGVAVAESENGPALSLLGDGVGMDGILSRARFDLSRGATLELSFRLPLTRVDRQVLHVCLGFGPTPVDEGTFLPTVALDDICFGTPMGEFGGFNPRSFGFVPFTNMAPPPGESALLPADDWRRVSIVLAPDGNARLFLNQQEAARLPWPMDNGPEARWYVRIAGAAVDTQLLIRDLVLWEGMRY